MTKFKILDPSNPIVFIAILALGFVIGECGKIQGWWGDQDSSAIEESR